LLPIAFGASEAIEELNVSLSKEIQRANELEAQLKMYQQHFGELPPDSLV
jgi:hypothetical protein